MKQSLLLFALVGLSLYISCASARKLGEMTMAERHEQWMAKYSRVYKDAAEKEMRLKVFAANYELIEKHNAGNHKYKLGANKFADLTNEEFKQIYNGYRRKNQANRDGASTTSSFKYENVSAVPASIDWRSKGAVTHVKDQGQCGKNYSISLLSY